MMTKEKLVAQIMRECEKEGEPVTKEEAEEMADRVGVINQGEIILVQEKRQLIMSCQVAFLIHGLKSGMEKEYAERFHRRFPERCLRIYSLCSVPQVYTETHALSLNAKGLKLQEEKQ